MQTRSIAQAGLLVLLLFLTAGCDERQCLSDGVAYDEVPQDSIFNGTCVAEGERFDASYSCEKVEGPCTDVERGQASRQVDEPDPARLTDPDLGWAQDQLLSCSCSCCHRDAGVSAHVWSSDFVDAVWTDSASDARLQALLEYPPHPGELAAEDNNGFTRDDLAMPTTDPARMRAFLERELLRRGVQ